MQPAAFDARVTSARPLSTSVREIVFARVDGMSFDFEPGQWVTLVLPYADDEIRRAYSIASPPQGGPTFGIAVTRVEAGPGSLYLHTLAPGDVVRVIGPQGFFTRAARGSPPSLFIGTGTGIAPLFSMIVAALEAGEDAPLWLLFGGREEHDLLYRDELDTLRTRFPVLRVEQTLSRGASSWSGRRGYVQVHARGLYEEFASTTSVPPHVYVCGLERMVGAVREIFRKEMVLPRQLVHSERYD